MLPVSSADAAQKRSKARPAWVGITCNVIHAASPAQSRKATPMIRNAVGPGGDGLVKR